MDCLAESLPNDLTPVVPADQLSREAFGLPRLTPGWCSSTQRSETSTGLAILPYGCTRKRSPQAVDVHRLAIPHFAFDGNVHCRDQFVS